MSPARAIATFTGFCLLLSATGCTSSIRWAEKARERVAPGMSQNEVREEIGEPVQIVSGDPGQPQVWAYQFETGPSTVGTILLIVFIVGIFVLLAFAKGGGGGGIHGGGGGDPPAEFKIDFDAEGRVVGISPIYLVPGR